MSTTSVDVAAPPHGEPVSFTTRLLPWVLALGGMVGLTAALVLTIEKIALIRDPGYVPSCSINPILSCGSIMSTTQSQVLGFPNPLLGIAGFAVVTTTGMVLLGGARLPRWFWVGLCAGTAFGVGFIHWLIYQSLYVIGALCPYCMVVWVITIPMFWYTILACLHHGYLPVPARERRLVQGLIRYHGVVLTAWYLIIALAVLHAFWTYWMTLL